MNPLIGVKINCSKIDKSLLFEGKGGAKWLDITLIPTPNSEYGEYMAVQSIPKADRLAGKKGAILGNGKLIEPRSSSRPAPEAETQSLPPEDDVPF